MRSARELGPAFVVVGVFDGMHLGHAYLLDHLVTEAAARRASPTVITFDHHPDEVLRGTAPALLLDPQERLERLEAAGLAVTVVQHFDDALRRTPYDAFVGTDPFAPDAHRLPDDARRRVRLRATRDAGHPRRARRAGRVRRGRRAAVHDRRARGPKLRDPRRAIAAGDFDGAARLLGRPVTITGAIGDPVDGGARLDFRLPVALPPDGEYDVRVGGAPRALRIRDGDAYLFGQVPEGRVTVELGAS